MAWRRARLARSLKAWAARGLPLTYVLDENGNQKLAKLPPKPKPKVYGPLRRREAEAIKRCIEALERTKGRGTHRDVVYKAHKRRRRDGRVHNNTRHHDWQNLSKPVRRWWPIVAAAWERGNHDLL